MDLKNTCEILVLPLEKLIKVESGITLKQVLTTERILFEFPCGGKGLCGKCLVDVAEKSSKALKQALIYQKVQACTYSINADITVLVPDSFKASNRKSFLENLENISFTNSKYKKLYLDLNEIQKDFSSDQELLMGVLKNNNLLPSNDLDLIRSLPAIFRSSSYKVTLGTYDGVLSLIEAEDTSKELYGIAFDIGTTTIAGYLLDLNSGQIIAVQSADNSQRIYGADVISRISHSLESNAGLSNLHEKVIESINNVIFCLIEKSGIEKDKIYEAAFVGNTVMLHLLLKVDPSNLAFAPFTPAFKYPPSTTALKLNIAINPFGKCTFIPIISGYVGSDITAAVLKTKLIKSNSIKLLIDIGTNGELVLGSLKKGFVACSAAAGPAFEGSQIEFGLRAAPGAIEIVNITDDVYLKTIDDLPPIGICGSGLIDAVAQMLKAGIIDFKGRICKPETLQFLPEKVRNRIIPHKKSFGFILSYKKDSGINEDILITQNDIREFQLAKGAILAGIKILQETLDIRDEDIDEIFVAGAFGSFINKQSALEIGLFPSIPPERIKAVGNAAGIGAAASLFYSEYEECMSISKSIKYLELSSHPSFLNSFMNTLNFPQL